MEQIKKFLEKELKIESRGIIFNLEFLNDLILEWNKKINLISRKQESTVKNILDSVFFLSAYNLRGNENIIDVGTGGGFPGIPLKILYPGIKLTLLDSTKKKINAVNYIIREMDLPDCVAIWGRAEEKSKENEYKGKFDIVTTLAVSSLVNIYKWCRGFLKKNGYMICLKGGDISEEIEDLNRYKSKIDYNIKEYSFDGYGDILQDKKIVIIRNKI
ncbi:MAG: 16S rRNA (guanine(527)-N(7))-methyltransferase RsmG [Ignavibacteria bacterium]|nr:16S rRNA (guanine(527)-N(7))-methyltransferase RsmG [Ignavibacteria bacterium]